MKKLILICLCTFFLTGCYDYQELNNRTIISGMGIDFKENQFAVTLEALNSKKSEGDSQNQSAAESYFIEGTGKTLSEAIQDANLKISKDPYYSHLKVVILSEDVARSKIDEIIDFMIREPNIRNIVIPVVALHSSAKEILNTITSENPVCSEAIQDLIENNKTNINIAIEGDFETFLDAIVDNRKDAVLNTIVKEDDVLKLKGIAAFKKSQMITTLNEEEASTYTVLKNTSHHYYVSVNCPKNEDKHLIVDLYDNFKTDIKKNDNQIEIKSNLTGSIIEDECHYDFRKTKNYEEIEEKIKEKVKENDTFLFQKLKQYKTDILELNSKTYKETRQDFEDWYNYPVKIDVDIDINKNGLIFEVIENE